MLIARKMKKLLLVTLLLFSFSSCIVEDDSPYYYNNPCYEDIDYNFHSINRVYNPWKVTIYFDMYCSNSYAYWLYVYDPFHGTEYINGQWWSVASSAFPYAPITTNVSIYGLVPSAINRCMIVSDRGAMSEEFLIYTY